MCTGDILEWTVCSDNFVIFPSTFQISLQIWRDIGGSQLKKMGSNNVTVSFRLLSTSVKCTALKIPLGERISIRRGDYLGAFVPRSLPVPRVVGSSLGIDSALYNYVSNNVGNIVNKNDASVLRLENSFLLITASIGGKRISKAWMVYV